MIHILVAVLWVMLYHCIISSVEMMWHGADVTNDACRSSVYLGVSLYPQVDGDCQSS